MFPLFQAPGSRQQRRTSPRRSPRRWAASVLSAVAFAVISVAGVPANAAETDDEAAFVDKINELRAGLGLSSLAVDTELVAASRDWAIQLRSDGALSHAADLSVGVTSNWAKLGENVGVADTSQLQELFDAFVASPGHYANLVDPAFTHVGTAVVYDTNGRMWTTHRFMAKVGTSPTTTTTPTTAPSTTQPSTTLAQQATTSSVNDSTTSTSGDQPTTTTTVAEESTTTTEPETIIELVTSPAHAPLSAVPTAPLDQGIVAELVRALSS